MEMVSIPEIVISIFDTDNNGVRFGEKEHKKYLVMHFPYVVHHRMVRS